jgi:tetratricopeptide (TPR) repeat protein
MPRSLIRASALLLLLLAPTAAGAQEDPHAACAEVGWVPREVLERPVPLRQGLGWAHDAATTTSKEAQAFYDQGLAYLHSYVWIEAARSFHQALRHDPGLALAHLGLSRAFSGLNDDEAARAALGRAQALTPKASERERRRIALRAVHMEALAAPADALRHLAYKRALDEALTKEMDEPELWLLRGNAEEATAGGRGQRGGAASIAFYRQALAVSPDHFAAHHYLIHSYETVNRMDDALVHGAAYARLAPAIPHAHHMYGHDLRRVGRVEDAIAAFRRTYELEKAYYAAEGIAPGLDWHHPHNLDLLATCYQHEGQMRTTERWMKESLAIPAVADGREFTKKEWAGFLLATGRVDEALAAARQLAKGRWPASRSVGHVFAGHALLAQGRLEDADAELKAAEAEREQVPLGPAMYSVTRSGLDPYVDGLRGELLLKRGQFEEARTLLKDVQRRIRAVPGPDAWTEALFRLEAIARAARVAGDWELAAYTAEQMRDHDAAYAGTHYALALVAEKRGEAEAARRAFAAAVDLWRGADPDLPELTDARRRLQAAQRTGE